MNRNELELYVRLIESGLSQLPSFKGTVFRGTNLTPEQLAKYKKDEIVTESAFTSTSTVAGDAFPGNTQFVINSKNGREISILSEYPNEKEVLFKSNTKFKVLTVDFDKKANTTVIYLDEINTN